MFTVLMPSIGQCYAKREECKCPARQRLYGWLTLVCAQIQSGRKCLLKNIQQARQAGRVQLPIFSCGRRPLSRQGRPAGIRKTGLASLRQGRGFFRPPVCPTPPAISSPYGGASGGQLTNCWHQMSSYDQYIIFPCFLSFFNPADPRGIT